MSNFSKPARRSIHIIRRRTPKREVEWDGRWYKVRSNKVDIPDLGSLPRFEALTWLCRETYPRGYARPNPLAGFCGTINVTGSPE